MGYSDVSKTLPVYGACPTGVQPTFSGCAAGIAPAYSGCARGGDVPSIISIAPGSMKAGQVVAITINGTFLGNVTSVLITPNTLIVVTNINVVNDNQLIVTFTLDVNAVEGIRQIAVVTPVGTSNAVDITITPGIWLGITVEPNLWVEADYGITDADNTALTTWRDRSSNANHFTVAPGKGAPTYKATGWNGGVRPYLQFNAAQGIKTAQAASLALRSATIFSIFIRDAADANSAIFYVISDLILIGVQDKAASYYAARWNAAHTVVLESSYHNTFGWIPLNVRELLRYEYAGTHATNNVFLGGFQQFLTNQLVNDPGTLAPTAGGLTAEARIGYRDTALPQFDMRGRHVAFVVYTPQLSAGNMAIVQAQLSAKWMT